MAYLHKPQIVRIALDAITPNPYQPRKEFRQEEIEELAASIQSNGLIQKITVIAKVDEQLNAVEGQYVLISGEKRLRAYQHLYATTTDFQYAAIEAVVDTFEIVNPHTYKERLMLNALAENINRTDLSLMEKAQSILAIREETGKSYAEIGQALGKSEGTLMNYVSFYNALTAEQRTLALRNRWGRVELERQLQKNRQQAAPHTRVSHSLTRSKKALQIHYVHPTLQALSNRKIASFVKENEQALSAANVARVDHFLRDELEMRDPTLAFFLVKKYIEEVLNGLSQNAAVDHNPNGEQQP